MQILLVHGRDYLSPKEFDDLFQNHISSYYTFLGKCLLLGQTKILTYHKRKLAELGLGFHWPRFLSGILATIWSLVLNPKSTVEKLLKTERQVNLARS